MHIVFLILDLLSLLSVYTLAVQNNIALRHNRHKHLCQCVCLNNAVYCQNDERQDMRCFERCIHYCDISIHTLRENGLCMDKNRCICVMATEWKPVCAEHKKYVLSYRTFSSLRNLHCHNICHNDYKYKHDGEC